MDYPDSALETEKSAIAETFAAAFDHQNKIKVKKTLLDLVGETTMNAYTDRVCAKLSARTQNENMFATSNTQRENTMMD